MQRQGGDRGQLLFKSNERRHIAGIHWAGSSPSKIVNDCVCMCLYFHLFFGIFIENLTAHQDEMVLLL